MDREINLIEYLPKFLQKYKELKIIQNTVNPEVENLFLEAEKVLNNQFILTCDEDGIENFENLLNIRHYKDEDLEVRRRRVLVKWNDDIPYTYEIFLSKLKNICGENNYNVKPLFQNYEIDIDVYLPNKGQVTDLNNMLDSVLPANIKCNAKNTLPLNITHKEFYSSCVTTNKIVTINTKI